MRFLTLLLCIVNGFYVNPKTNSNQEELCEHNTDGLGKSKGIAISLQLPCDWKEIDNKTTDQIFNYAKKNDEIKVMTSASLNITDLPDLNASEEQELLKPNGLKRLSEGSGEIESSKQLKVDNITGGQIIRKDLSHNFFKIRNYFIYKRKLISISYFIVSTSPIEVKEYCDAFDSYLMKTKIK